MTATAYHVVWPFTTNEDGDLVPLEAVECQSPGTAVTRARALAAKHGGAVDFSRTRDPQSGDFDEAVVLERLGTVPDDLTAASGAG